MARDPFHVLGVAHDATATEVDAAWREQMRRLHPDANPGADAVTLARLTALAAEVNAAHALLRGDLAGQRALWAPRPAGSPAMPVGESPVLLPVRIPGGDLFRRPITWVVLTVAAVVGLLLLNAVGNPAPPESPGTPTSLTRSPGWYVGSCVAGTGDVVVPVRCSEQHSGLIVAQTGAQQYCPATAEGAVFRDNVYFCIDVDAQG
jgi:hypothetical protein